MVLQKYGGNYDLETCFCSGNDLTLRYLTWLCSTIIVAFSRRGPCTSSDDTSHKYGRLFHILKSRLGGIQGRCTVALTEMGSDCEGYHPINSLGNQSRIYDRLLKTCSIYILHLHVEITRVLLLTIYYFVWHLFIRFVSATLSRLCRPWLPIVEPDATVWTSSSIQSALTTDGPSTSQPVTQAALSFLCKTIA